MGASFSRDPKKIEEYILRRKIGETTSQFTHTFEQNFLREPAFQNVPSDIPSSIEDQPSHRVIRVTPKLVEDVSALPSYQIDHLLNMISNTMPEATFLVDESFHLPEDNPDVLWAVSYYLQALTEMELHTTLRQLYEIYSNGFIQQFEYETRKYEIEIQLNALEQTSIVGLQ